MTQKRLWFKAKGYGWGWYPVTWQGWGVTLLYVLALFGLFGRVQYQANSPLNLCLSYFPAVIVLTVFLLIICWITGEKPRWRWGGK